MFYTQRLLVSLKNHATHAQRAFALGTCIYVNYILPQTLLHILSRSLGARIHAWALVAHLKPQPVTQFCGLTYLNYLIGLIY